MVNNGLYYRGALCLIKNNITYQKIGILTGKKETYTVMINGKLKSLKTDTSNYYLYEVLVVMKKQTKKILLSPIDFKLL